jgi:hypothetical protein
VATLAVAAHAGFREVAELDEDEFVALQNAVMAQHRQRAWTHDTEALATLVDTVNALRLELASGIPVVLVKKSDRPEDPEPYPRPAWIAAASGTSTGDTLVIHPRDLGRRLMKGGSGGH